VLRILYVTTPRYDFTTATLIQGLNALPDVEVRTTAPGNYAEAFQVLSRSDAIDYGRNADVLVLGYTRGADSSIFWSVVNEGPVRVFVDGGDHSELAVSLRQLPKLHVVFKREFFVEDRSISNLLRLARRVRPGIWGTIRRHPLVPFPSFIGLENKTRFRDFLRNAAVLPMTRKFHPFPYGIEERFQGSVNRTPAFELSCMMTGHIPERREFVARLESLGLPNAFIGEIPSEPEDTERLMAMRAVDPGARRRVEFGHNERYYARIGDSRRCISIPGGGFDTLRFWEILGLGALLISKRVAIEMPQPLVEGRHYLAFDSFEELRAVVEKSYRQPDEADEIRTNGHAFALQFHTTRARAIYLLTTLVDRGLLARDRLPAIFDAAPETFENTEHTEIRSGTERSSVGSVTSVVKRVS
jgi:Glycosyl transferases group 1